MADRDSWPDDQGLDVGVGDWIEVWCSWTRQPKFEGRSVRVEGVQGTGANAVFKLRDPEGRHPSYMPAHTSGFRRSTPPPSISQVMPKASFPDDEEQVG